MDFGKKGGMNCHEIIERIIAQSGRPVLTPEVEAHVGTCPGCAKVYLEQQALWRQMDAWETPDVSPGFDNRLFARIGRRVSEPWAPLDWLARLFSPVQPRLAAALACMLVIATVVVQRGRYVPAPPAPAVVTQAVDREDVGQIELALDDIQMLNDFEILPVGEPEEGRS